MKERCCLLWLSLALALVVSPLSADDTAPSVPFLLPTPDGWAEETIPFPLGFAPDIDYSGIEEVRLSNGMFDRDHPNFWTYAFVWWLEGDVDPDAARLTEDLDRYYRGLAKAVSAGQDVDPEAIQTDVQIDPLPAAGGRKAFRGRLTVFDAFATRAALQLNARITSWRCEAEGRRVVMFELSPQPPDGPGWDVLDNVRQGFRCSKGDPEP